MRYQLEENRCEGWWRGVFTTVSSSSKSAKWPDRDGAMRAIRFHHANGKWPREVEAHDVEVCQSCGQPLPD